MTNVEKKQLLSVTRRVIDLERKLEDPDWEHVNNPVAYAQGAYKRICALEREVESRIQAGQDVRRRLSRVEKRVDTAHERRVKDRILYRIGQLERVERVRDDMSRARSKRRHDLYCEGKCVAQAIGIVIIFGFAVYGFVTLVSKFV